MRLFRYVLLSVFAFVITAGSASAAPIVCSATLSTGQGPAKLYQASVDPAVACSGPTIANDVFPSDLVAFGFTWLAQDKDPGGDATENNANENVLTIVGADSTSGTFTIDPANSQCGLLDCNYFVFALKFGPAVAYFDLGQIASPMTFNWSTNRNALSHGAAYGRYEGSRVFDAPEPGMMLLLATGAVVGIRRRLRRAWPR